MAVEMQEWLATALKWTVGVLATGFMGLLSYVANREVRRVDDCDARLKALEADRVTRADFDQLTASMQASLNTHTEAVRKDLRVIQEHLLRDSR